MDDRTRLLACRTEEEWQWWIEELMLGYKRDCLFCDAYGRKIFGGSHEICPKCLRTSKYPEGFGGPCIRKYKNDSDRYIAAWDRLRRAGIV